MSITYSNRPKKQLKLSTKYRFTQIVNQGETMSRNTLNTLKEFKISDTKKGKFYSLPALEKKLGINISRLPVSIRIVLESVLRNCDGKKVTEEHVRQLAAWNATGARTEEIPFVVSRVVLQDFTGVPLLADLAAMRNVAAQLGKDPKNIEPLVPVDLVVDHSVQIDHFREKKALDLNMKLEFQRNNERYQFMNVSGVRTASGMPLASLRSTVSWPP